MNKIPTLFVRDEIDRSRVTRHVNIACEWVINGAGTATRKYDGTCIMYDGSRWWARREVKPGKQAPAGYIAIEHDPLTGKTAGFEPVEHSAFFKYVIAAHQGSPDREYPPGTYELCGPRINGNPEGYDRDILLLHDDAEEIIGAPRDYDGLAAWMAETDFEGIVWHHPDGRMAKLKRKDFGGAV